MPLFTTFFDRRKVNSIRNTEQAKFDIRQESKVCSKNNEKT